MKACIVIPCSLMDDNLFNITVRFLNSLDHTTYPNFEVLIYNNNSKRHLTERLSQHINIYYKNKDKYKIKTIKNYRFNLSQVYNWSLKDSNAELFVFCNNDMEIINQEWLSNIVKWFDITPDMGICIPYQYGDTFKMIPEDKLTTGGGSFAMYAMSRKIIESIGGFDERFDLYCQDHDVFHSILSKGYKVTYAMNALVKHYGDRTTINHPNMEHSYDLGRSYGLLNDKHGTKLP
jgi:glycosyltransferase involved in cell wall biosynthesis